MVCFSFTSSSILDLYFSCVHCYFYTLLDVKTVRLLEEEFAKNVVVALTCLSCSRKSNAIRMPSYLDTLQWTMYILYINYMYCTYIYTYIHTNNILITHYNTVLFLGHGRWKKTMIHTFVYIHTYIHSHCLILNSLSLFLLLLLLPTHKVMMMMMMICIWFGPTNNARRYIFRCYYCNYCLWSERCP